MQEKNQTENDKGGKNSATNGKYLTFALAGEGYGIPILKVKEIIGLMHLTELPQSPSHIKGVINLRDHVIPIVDLKEKFAMPSEEYNERTCIIILETQSLDRKSCWEVLGCSKPQCPGYKNVDRRCWMITGTHCRNEIQGSFYEKIHSCKSCNYYSEMAEEKSIRTMGVIVDGVSEVCQIHTDQIESPPSLTGDIETQYISGIGKTKEGIKILLDIDRTLSG